MSDLYDLEAIVDQEVAAYREVPGPAERGLPLGVAWLILQAEGAACLTAGRARYGAAPRAAGHVDKPQSPVKMTG